MVPRRRVLAASIGLVVLAGAVLALRITGTPADLPAPPAPTVTRHAAPDVVLPPAPETPPGVPATLTATPGPRLLRIAWADGVPGGAPVGEVAGYELTWHGPGEPVHTRLVPRPATELDDLTDGTRYDLAVRAVDAFGRRSGPATTTATPGPADTTWRAGLTGFLDDFPARDTPAPGPAWHLSGYPGCVDPSWRAGHLTISLRCGADQAVLRARVPLALGTGHDLGHVTVVTDTAGPGGQLTIDLVPGPADRVGTARAAGPDPGLPSGTIRVLVDDQGARVLTVPTSATPEVPGGRPNTPDVPGRPSASPATAPRRGAGVLDRFEVLLTTAGVSVLQNGVPVAASGAVPTWRSASVLFGFSGPVGVPATIRVAAAGLSGPPTTPPAVAEARLIPAVSRVLRPTDPAPDIGVTRQTLIGATTARLVTTITTTPGLDTTQLTAQLGDRHLPLRPAVPGPPPAPGAPLTLYADLPPDLLTATGPEPLSPFVLRAPGATEQTTITDTYAEITPGPGWQSPSRPAEPAPEPTPQDQLPMLSAHLADGFGNPVATVSTSDTWLLVITLDGSTAAWRTGGLAGVAGIEVRIDTTVIAALPTATHGPGIGGRYVLAINPGLLLPGPHTIEVRELPTTTDHDPVSALITATFT